MKLAFLEKKNRVFIEPLGIDEKVYYFQTKKLSGEAKLAALKLAISLLDITTLEGADTPGKIKQMCSGAAQIGGGGFGSAAAVCVYPAMVSVAREWIDKANSTLKLASVATAFPSGQLPLHLKLNEVLYAVEQGADEIDMVMNRGKFLCGRFDEVYEEIQEVKNACGKAHLKVIIEAGELETFENMRLASDIAMHAGADFIKTSTGKTKKNATLANTLVMLYAINDFYCLTGKKVGMKPAGGISYANLALKYLIMVREILGKDWLSPELFRFGASSLTTDLLFHIKKHQSGIYASTNYLND